MHRLSPVTGRTILSATYSGIWLSATNARRWLLAPGSPTGVGEVITTYKQPGGIIYADFAPGGVFYPHDNGYHWTRLGYPPGNITNGDVWAITIAPAGPYTGYLMMYAGQLGSFRQDGNWYLVPGATVHKLHRTEAGISAGIINTQNRWRWTSRCSLSIRPRRG